MGLDGKKGTSCVEGAMNGKEKRWKRGLEQSAAYQWTQGVKQKGKVTKVSHNKFFQKSNEKSIDTVYNHEFSIEPHAVGGGLLEKNGSFSSWSKIIAYARNDFIEIEACSLVWMGEKN